MRRVLVQGLMVAGVGVMSLAAIVVAWLAGFHG